MTSQLEDVHSWIVKAMSSLTIFLGMGRKSMTNSFVCNPIPDPQSQCTFGLFVFVVDHWTDPKTKKTRFAPEQLMNPLSAIYAPADTKKAVAEVGLRWIPSANICNSKLLGGDQNKLGLFAPELLDWTIHTDKKKRLFKLQELNCAAALAARVVDRKQLDPKDPVDRCVLDRLETNETFAEAARPYDPMSEYLVLFLVRTPDGSKRIPILRRCRMDPVQDATEVQQDFLLRCFICDEARLGEAPVLIYPKVLMQNEEETDCNQVLREEGVFRSKTKVGFPIAFRHKTKPQEPLFPCTGCGIYYTCAKHMVHLNKKHNCLDRRSLMLSRAEMDAQHLVGSCLHFCAEDEKTKAFRHAQTRVRRIVRTVNGVPIPRSPDSAYIRQLQFILAEQTNIKHTGVPFVESLRTPILFPQ